MKLVDFFTLPGFKQLNHVYQNGAYIGKRLQDGLEVLLYQLDGFYIEIYYSR
jgi:hypothetical protein